MDVREPQDFHDRYRATGQKPDEFAGKTFPGCASTARMAPSGSGPSAIPTRDAAILQGGLVEFEAA
jgi:hypothetical protein